MTNEDVSPAKGSTADEKLTVGKFVSDTSHFFFARSCKDIRKDGDSDEERHRSFTERLSLFECSVIRTGGR